MATQVTAAELKAMTAEQIVQAHQEGRLEALLTTPVNDSTQASAAARAAEQISDADAQRIDGINEPGARNYHGKV